MEGVGVFLASPESQQVEALRQAVQLMLDQMERDTEAFETLTLSTRH
jgi:hypothetical protein